MEEEKFPLAVSITKIENSKRSPQEILQGFHLLKRIISNLITYPDDDKYKHFRKENEALAKTLFILDGVHTFLKSVGFEEKDGLYKHAGGDDKMKLLEAALKLINFHINSLEKSKISPDKSKLDLSGRKDVDRSSISDKSGYSASTNQSVKRDLSPKKDSGYSFTQGHFHQQGNQQDKKKAKQVQEVFDQHDYNNKKGNAFISFLKMG